MLYEPGLGTLPFERDRHASDEPNVWMPLTPCLGIYVMAELPKKTKVNKKDGQLLIRINSAERDQFFTTL
jgi:hypothetical protein